MCGWRINKKLCPRIYCTFSKLYFGHKYTAHNSNQPSKNVRELYRLYRETFPVAPVSQALIIIFTTRTPSALLHSTPSCFVCVCNSIQTHLHHSETASHDGLCTCRNASFTAVHTGRVLYVLRSFLNGIGENAQIEDRLLVDWEQ